MNQIKHIAVIGAGTMGNGIAHVFAQYGFKVSLIDRETSILNKALEVIEKNLTRQAEKKQIKSAEIPQILSSISLHSKLEEGIVNANIVIEAIIEDLEVKKQLFRSLSEITATDTILASNTSSISITQLAQVTSKPEKVIGMHFMNPVPLMTLVEVISGQNSSKQTIDTVESLTQKIGKTAVHAKDYPGFIANRILMPMINEAIISLHEGVADVEAIDSIMKLGMAHPMGPLQLADFIGLDVCLSILKVLYDGLGNPKYAPCPLLVNMVTAGKLGVKSKEGFYDYSAGIKEATVSTQFK